MDKKVKNTQWGMGLYWNELKEKFNELEKGTKLGLGFVSLCSVCGSIFGATWLFNQQKSSIRVLENSVKAWWNDLNEVKGDWNTHKQKYEELKNSNNLLFFKVAELEEAIEDFGIKFSKEIEGITKPTR